MKGTIISYLLDMGAIHNFLFHKVLQNWAFVLIANEFFIRFATGRVKKCKQLVEDQPIV